MVQHSRFYGAVTFALLLFAIVTATAFAETYKMTTPIAPGVAVPDTVESSIGTLHLNDGYPSAETVEKIYDNLTVHAP
jgi:hypothetical protein